MNSAVSKTPSAIDLLCSQKWLQSEVFFTLDIVVLSVKLYRFLPFLWRRQYFSVLEIYYLYCLHREFVSLVSCSFSPQNAFHYTFYE